MSAAPSLFDPVDIPTGHGSVHTYVDRALGSNNPVQEVAREARRIWSPSNSPNYEPIRVHCFISLGTGELKLQEVEHGVKGFLTRTMSRVATETDATARLFQDNWGSVLGYYRFSVTQGLQEVGIGNHEQQQRTESATQGYLNDFEVRRECQQCVQSLLARDAKSEIREFPSRKVHQSTKQFCLTDELSTCLVYAIQAEERCLEKNDLEAFTKFNNADLY